MRFLGNVLWFIFGGAILALGWFIAGLLCYITIIGIPLGAQCMKIASLVLCPFGKDINYSRAGFGSCVGNFLWIALFGWELALGAAVTGCIWCVTIVGIPFGLQFFKFAQLAFMPFGASFH